MADRLWYTAIGGKQEGPYSDQRLRELIAAGTVRADTLVWCDGMTNWAQAGDVPGLVPAAARVPPPLPPGGAPHGADTTGAGAGSFGAGPLSSKIRVWPYFGRAVVIVIAQITIIPAPWVMTSFYQWFVDNTEFPGGQRVFFAGRPGDIWYIFILNALCGYIGIIGRGANLLILPLTTLFLVIIMRWFFRNLVWEEQIGPVTFTGGYWRMLGWYVLFILAFITIVGWAWVATAWMRWICRHLEGSVRKPVFTATGWGLLWRSVLFFLSCIFLVPIPWTLHWYTRWMVSQYALADGVPPSAASA